MNCTKSQARTVVLNAPCRKFVHNVFEYKLSLSGSKWTFEIDNSNIDYYQKNLVKQMIL